MIGVYYNIILSQMMIAVAGAIDITFVMDVVRKGADAGQCTWHIKTSW